MNNPYYDFDDRSIPPLVKITSLEWLQAISTNEQIRQTFDHEVLAMIISGSPAHAAKVYSLLSFWVAVDHDGLASQHIHALRLRLEAYVFCRSLIDDPENLPWGLLGALHCGNQILLRLDRRKHLSPTGRWKIVTLWNWNFFKSSAVVACGIGSDRPTIQLSVNSNNLRTDVLLFLVPVAHLWPSSYPVIDTHLLNRELSQGRALEEIVEVLQRG